MHFSENQQKGSKFLALSRKNPKTINIPLQVIREERDIYLPSPPQRMMSDISISFPNIHDKSTEGKIEKEDINREYLEFLMKLKRFSAVYLEFTAQARVWKIIKNTSKSLTRKPSYKGISLTPKPNSINLLNDLPTPEDRSDFKKSKFESRNKSRPKESDDSSSQVSSEISTIGFNKLRSRERTIDLKGFNLKLKEIFYEITGNKSKLYLEDFKRFLCRRYSPVISEGIASQFYFQLGSFDDFFVELNKLVNFPRSKQLEFCFNIFDINKDKLICYKDAFSAIEARIDSLYDNDLRLIIEQIELKKQGKIVKDRTNSSNAKERPQKKKKDILTFLKGNPYKDINISINLKEFCKINFPVRPLIFLDIIEYLTSLNFLKEKGLLKKNPVISSKDSDFILTQVKQSEQFCQELKKNDKYDYYIQLESALTLFTKRQGEELLKKFKYLQLEEKLKYKVITKASMIEKLVKIIQPGLIGFSNKYFSERVYEYFSGGKDLTKPIFLNKVYYLTMENRENVASRMAFDIIDSKKDERLTVDEVYKMFEVFPISSPGYEEIFK